MRTRRLIGLGVLYAALLVGGAALGQWLTGLVAFDVRPSTEPRLHAMIMSVTALYLTASAVPFVPGAEIGLTLILVLGRPIVLLVYCATVAALTLAYLVGRVVPPRTIAGLFAFFGLTRAHDLVLAWAPLGADERLALLSGRAPRRIVPFLLRHRYVALGLAFNLPGNSLLGGGGIGLAAGMSRLYPLGVYLLTVAVAVAPVPLFFLLTGV